jgi:hypothetical protein
MSVPGQKQKSSPLIPMSALPPEADIHESDGDVRLCHSDDEGQRRLARNSLNSQKPLRPLANLNFTSGVDG